ncbi:unnamed protein product [Adineta ricciae]|uniref:Uncharacterized protein n=1 Tax=Adineta ricciae TaxID=249248 RepID=A0A816D280_ADIRI|nr:unnamed protein product [Adineta ricciae]
MTYNCIKEKLGYDSCEGAFHVAKQKRRLGSSYRCYYNSKNELDLQWDKPNSNPNVVLVIISSLLTFVLLLLLIIFIKKDYSNDSIVASNQEQQQMIL